MKIALGQFAVMPEWQNNLQKCIKYMNQATQEGAKLLVLPESILARDINDPKLFLTEAQPLDGPFVQGLLEASKGSDLTTIFTIIIPDSDNKALNVLLAIKNGEITARYDKLHLYDAFLMQESKHINSGNEIPALLDIDGFKFGLMICYDVRFPELARSLALSGADAFVLPTAWLKGPQKEHHWNILNTCRALENTCYMIAVGECGPSNIGNSLVVDPLGIVITQLSEEEQLVFSELDKSRIDSTRQKLPVLQNTRFAPPVLK